MTARWRPVIAVGLLISLLAVAIQDVRGEEQTDEGPSEVLCRPYIEKALKHRDTGSELDGEDVESRKASEEVNEIVNNSNESIQAGEAGDGSSEVQLEESQKTDSDNNDNDETAVESSEASKQDETAEDAQEETKDSTESVQIEEQESVEQENVETVEEDTAEEIAETEEKSAEESAVQSEETDTATTESEIASSETEIDAELKSKEDEEDATEDTGTQEVEKSTEEEAKSTEKSEEPVETETLEEVSTETQSTDANEVAEEEPSVEQTEEKSSEDAEASEEEKSAVEEEEPSAETAEKTAEESAEEKDESVKEAESKEADVESVEKAGESLETAEETAEKVEVTQNDEPSDNVATSDEATATTEEKSGEQAEESTENEDESEEEPTPEEDLIQEIEIPENIRPRDHIGQILRLDQDTEEREAAIQKAADIVLRDLKKLYDTAIKPLETLYKYRDLSNRHFGDPEIFSKPLILFMGPWSGGKSSIINYLLDIEYKPTALRTGAEPSPAYFNILMYGEEDEVLDGTQLAADWTFSGLQKFGQGMLDRLRGLKLKNKLLEKVNIVEIPGILEIRKQVQRLFPFNDACQWFIDRADIIFLIYDPSKLDVGPETEAILDQLKGREYQTRIVLNKADQVKPEELMRVQGALIWNISPLMSSAEPPVMYSTSLWSMPYEQGSPTRLLYAQERAFLRDLRSAVDKRVEHKIASARRFAVRVRNHAKMVDCYLTTYYNHKSFFGSKKEISDKIIENPQDYHIYEGLSTLTNISRYDLPDPDVYRDFFRLNSLYDFPLLSSTCTYFRGCPINRLDVAIAYDLPELVGNYRKSVEAMMHEANGKTPAS